MGKFKVVKKAAPKAEGTRLNSLNVLSLNDKRSIVFNESAMDVLDIMIEDGLKVDMIFTDPPYRVTPRGNEGNTGGMFKKDIIKSGKVFKVNDLDIEDWLPKFYEVLKDNCHCYIMINDKNLSHYLRVIEDSKFHFVRCLIWVKGNKVAGTSYMNQHEYIIMLRKGGFRKLNDNGCSDVLQIALKKKKSEDGKNLHDTEKPVLLTDILVENSSNENEIVFDPFMGIGGCGVSCRKSNRKFIGVEVDKRYFEIATQRITGNDLF